MAIMGMDIARGGGSMAGAPPGSIDGDPLAQPPPSPTPMGGQPGPFSLQGLGGAPSVPTEQLPPEVLTGIESAAQRIIEMLDSFSQFTPDKGAQISIIKALLDQYLKDLQVAGAGAISPTASGPAFPGGGLSRGISGAGAI